MPQVILMIRLVAELLPALISMVQAIENAVPAGGAGEQKLELLKTSLQHGLDVEKNLELNFGQVWPVVQPIVGGIVSLFNAAGIFKK